MYYDFKVLMCLFMFGEPSITAQNQGVGLGGSTCSFGSGSKGCLGATARRNDPPGHQGRLARAAGAPPGGAAWLAQGRRVCRNAHQLWKGPQRPASLLGTMESEASC